MGRRTLLLIASILVAALGTALIWLYVQGAESRAEAGEAQVRVLVATLPVSAGASASAVKSQSKQFPASIVAALGPGVLTDPAQVTGFTKTDIVTGMPLLRSQFTTSPTSPAPAVDLQPNELAMQVTLPDPQRLAGLLQPGSHIRVFTVVEKGTVKGAAVLFNDVRVLGSGPVSNASGTVKGEVPQAVVTLALSNDQAKELVLAQSGGGSLWFGLLGAGKTAPDSGDITRTITPGGS
jgi:pilus assembly protein CpaB